LHPDPVADPGLTWWAGRPLIDGYPDPSEPQDRIDIIYAAGPSTTTAIRIVGEAGGPQVDIEVDPWGTDHRGVVGEFRLRPGIPAPFVSVDSRLISVGDTATLRFLADDSSSEIAPQAVRMVGPGTSTVVWEPSIDELAGEAAVSDLLPGRYDIELVASDNVVASTHLTVVEPGTQTTISTDQSSYASGEPVTISWQAGPGARWDWVGLFPAGSDSADGDYRFYVYTGQQINGTVTFDQNGEGEWPIPPGDYEVHYLSDDGYQSLAAVPVTITP
jgi:hypothetical protein